MTFETFLKLLGALEPQALAELAKVKSIEELKAWRKRWIG